MRPLIKLVSMALKNVARHASPLYDTTSLLHV